MEASGLHDSNLNTLSTPTPRGQDQELHGHIKKEWQIKMMAVFFLNIRVLNFMRNPKLAHILVSQIGERIVLADFLTNIVMLIYIDY